MLEALIENKPAWLLASGDAPIIAISTRMRLARNLAGLPFPHRCTPKQRREIIATAVAALRQVPAFHDAGVFQLQELSALERQFLVERHLTSPEFAAQKEPAALLVSADQGCVVMIMEEDVLRLQVLECGLALERSWQCMDALDTALEQHLTYAFSPRYGYLTACPTNVGTGLRASVMLHLPALVHENAIGSVISAMGKVGIAVRGLYGERSDVRGNMFQISNQVTLGRAEADIVRQLSSLVDRIIEHETRLRDHLRRTAPHKLRNAVGRAYGTLRYAEILRSDEAAELLSLLLMGIDLQVFDDVDRSCISELLIDIQPAHLQLRSMRQELTPEDRDILRAELVRTRLEAHGRSH